MRSSLLPCVLAAVCLVFGVNARASSFSHITTEQHVNKSEAVFRGEILALRSYRDTNDHHLYTTASIQVDEVFKGKLPAIVNLTHRGGSVGNIGQADGLSPQLRVGEHRLFFVSRRRDGTLFATRGQASALKLPASPDGESSPDAAAGQELLLAVRNQSSAGVLPGGDLTDQAGTSPAPAGVTPQGSPVSLATNLLVDENGIPARFILPDRGEPIPYLVDIDPTLLPAGMTQDQALNAVQNALNAWTAVTTLKYVFAGIQSFNEAAGDVETGDGILRIQLHDRFNYIAATGGGGDILGVGGHIWINPVLPAGWTSGGNVNGSDFHQVINGYVVLASTNPEMQSLSLFTEVLCHEIGHTIGLAHSSENPSETNPLLKNATMYFEVHGGNRGATLGAYDPPVARQAHPTNNTPPYAFDRLIDVVTTPSPINLPNVNEVQLRGYDLQTTNLTIATNAATANNGNFSLVNNILTFVPKAFFSDSTRIDPSTGSAYDRVNARVSDGTNASPFITIRVASFGADSHSEGIPDSWRTTFFGNANPATGAKHHATDDADGDGFSNLIEFRLGSDPTNKDSNLRITTFNNTTNLQWQARPYEVYEIYGSTNLSKWVRLKTVLPTNNPAVVTSFTNGSPFEFIRIEKVP